MEFQVEIKTPETEDAAGVIEVGTAFLEAYFNVTRESIRKWTQRGCPKLSRGRWDFIAVLKWRGGLAPIDVDEDESDAHNYNLRKLKAETFLKEQQGQIAEIELQKLQGKVVDVDEVEDAIGNIIMNSKGLLLALPSKAAPKLVGVSVLENLKSILFEHSPGLLQAKSIEAVNDVISLALTDFYDCKSLAEINEVLTALVYEVLEELAAMETIEGVNDADE